MGLLKRRHVHPQSILNRRSSEKDAANGGGEQAQSQQVCSLFGSETMKIGAKFALTGRYRVCLPQSSEQARRPNTEARQESAADAAEKAWYEVPDFKADPPGLALLEDTMLLLRFVADKCRTSTPASSTFTDSVLFFLGIQQETRDDPLCMYAQLRAPQSDTAHLRHRLQNSRAVDQFLSCLMQPSHRSWHAGDLCKKIRSSHMNRSRIRWLCDNNGMKLTSREDLDPNEASNDALALIETNDFPIMLLSSGSWRLNGETPQHQGKDCTVALLHIRVILECQPFFLICFGAERIGTFFQLAEQTGLHLQLLPVDGQLDQILSLMKPGTKESRVVNEVLLEVSCCAQDSTAYELSVVGEAGCKKIINADITKALDALGLIKVVRSIRNKGGPFIIQSTTSDLPKVMFALYMDLLITHKPIHLMLVGTCGRKEQWPNMSLEDIDLFKQMSERTVDPSLHFHLHCDLHSLLIG